MTERPADRRRRRSKARTLAFVVLYLVLLLAFLEISARVVLAVSISRFADRALPEGYEGELARVSSWSNVWGGGYVRDPVLRYYHQDGLFRSSEGWTDFQRTDEELVIMCLGSSTTYGLIVPAHESYPALLQSKLDAALPDRRIRVLNAGLPGANPRQSKRLYQFRLRDYEPDILIWRQTPRLTDRLEVDTATSPVRHAAWWVVAHSKLVALLAVAATRGEEGDLAADLFDYVFGRATNLEPEVGSQFRSNYHMVKHMQEEQGGHTLALEYLTVSDPREAEPFVLTDAYLYAAIGVTEVIRTERQFRAVIRDHGTSAVFRDIEHMSVLGTEVMAQASFEHLMRDPFFRSKLGLPSLSGAGADPGRPQSVLDGRVVDRSTGRGLPGVAVNGESTDADGSFSVSAPFGGPATLDFSGDGYVDWRVSLAAPPVPELEGMLEVGLYTEAEARAWHETVSGVPWDPGLGVVIVEMRTREPEVAVGLRADLVEPFLPGHVFDSDRSPLDGTTIASSAAPQVVFTGVPPGPVRLDLGLHPRMVCYGPQEAEVTPGGVTQLILGCAVE